VSTVFDLIHHVTLSAYLGSFYLNN